MGVNRVSVKAHVDIRALMNALTHSADAKVGYPEETTGAKIHTKAKMPIAQLAALNELGHETTPPRPFMRQGADLMEQRRGLVVPHVQRLVTGRIHGNKFMEAVGALLKANIASAVKRGSFAPLQQATIDAEGNADILRDTNEMIDALDVHLER